MKRGWTWLPLDQVVEDILDRRGVTPTKLGSSFMDAGHRVISAKLIKDGAVDFAADEPRFVDDSTYRKWMKSALRADDVLLTSEAPLGERAYLRHDVDWALGQRLFCLRSKKDVLHGRFLYYALAHAEVSADLHGRATGTTVMGIRQSELRKVRVPVPDLGEQRRIAAILGGLDDLIDLIRRMNATLEATAQALFQSWFVDFDGHDDFVDSELGRIPRGWRVTAVGEHVTLQRGTTYKSQLLGQQGPVLLGLGSIHPGGGFRASKLKTYGGDSPESLLLYPGEVYGSLKGATKDGDMVGSVARVPRSVRVGRLTQDTVRLIFSDAIEGMPDLVYRLLRSPQCRKYYGARATGSAQVGLSRGDFLGYRFAVPEDSAIIATFARVERLVITKQECNNAQAATLLEARDALLPRLLSGEIRVPGAEAAAAAAL